MDLNAITQLIATLGFPICMCLILLYYIKYIMDKHESETTALREVLENMTVAVTKLCEKIDNLKGDD